jgi:peptide/nickel transport system permease protein
MTGTDTTAGDVAGVLVTPDPNVAEDIHTPRTTGPTRRALGRLRYDKVAVVALSFIVLMVLVAIFANWLAPYDPVNTDADKFLSPSFQHLLGTDYLGRDILSRLIVGTTVTIKSGFITIAIAVLIAVPVGLFAGYVGGAFDNIVMRIMDAVNAFPALVLALAIAAVLGPSLENAMIAITVVLIPGLVRITRAQALGVRQETFVEASHAVGTRRHVVVRKRVLPGVLTALIVAISLAMGGALLAESALSFLGLGVQPPNASWGSMLQDGYVYVNTQPMLIIYPGVLIALAILSFNLLGDCVNDALGQAHRQTKSRKQRKAERAASKGVRTKRARMGLTRVVQPAVAADAGAPSVNGDAAPAVRVPTVAPAPHQSDAILEVRGLGVSFDTEAGPLTVVDDVSFSLAPGEVLGLVGESGSGKTVTSLAIMRLIKSPPGQITGGEVLYDGRNLLDLDFDEMRDIRGHEIAMVFQDPMSSLDPSFTIGHQLTEVIRFHAKMRREQARTRALELLELVGIPDARARMKEYPHRLSGGMRQRVMIAMALINEPKVLIADEPTTALDVTIQAQILDLLKHLQAELGMSLIFVTHDLGVVADLCDRVVVMYAGQVVEQSRVFDLYVRPRHPYTEALLGAIPRADDPSDRLTIIPGVVPTPDRWPTGCRFADRCGYAAAECRVGPIELAPIGDGRLTRCVRSSELGATTNEQATR